MVISNLQKSPYAQADPNVIRYAIKASALNLIPDCIQDDFDTGYTAKFFCPQITPIDILLISETWLKKDPRSGTGNLNVLDKLN